MVSRFAPPMYRSETARQSLGAAGHATSFDAPEASIMPAEGDIVLGRERADPFAVPEPLSRRDPNAALVGPGGRTRAEIAASDRYLDDDEAAFYLTTQKGMIPQSAAEWLKQYTKSQRAKLAAVDVLPEVQAFGRTPVRRFAEGGSVYFPQPSNAGSQLANATASAESLPWWMIPQVEPGDYSQVANATAYAEPDRSAATAVADGTAFADPGGVVDLAPVQQRAPSFIDLFGGNAQAQAFADPTPAANPMMEDFSAAPEGSLRDRVEQARRGQSQYSTIPQRVYENPETLLLLAGGMALPELVALANSVPLLGAGVRLAGWQAAGLLGSEGVQELPGFEDLPMPLQRAGALAPYFLSGPGSLATKGGGVLTAVGGGELSEALGFDRGTGEFVGGFAGAGVPAIVKNGLKGVRNAVVDRKVGDVLDDLAAATDEDDLVRRLKAMDPMQLMEVNEALLRHNPQLAKELGTLITRSMAGDMAAAQALRSRTFGEATSLSKRVAQMTGEAPSSVRQRAVRRVSEQFGKLGGPKAGIVGDGAETAAQAAPKAGTKARALNDARTAAEAALGRSLTAEEGAYLAKLPKSRLATFATEAAEAVKKPVDIDAKQSLGSRLKDEAAALIGSPRTLKASYDLSAPGRQGLALGVRHPIEWVQGWAPMMKAWASEKGAQAVNESIEQLMAGWKAKYGDDLMHFYQTGADAPGLERVPGFESAGRGWIASALRKLPGMENSERAYSTFLNYQKAKTFNTMARSMERAGVTDPKQYKALGTLLDHATGYGAAPLKGRVEGQAFFSQRYMTSRFQFLTDPIVEGLAKGDLRTARMGAENLVAFVGAQAVALTLLKESGLVDVELDPRSTDFGKIRIGGQRFDAAAGFLPIVRTAARIATGEAKAVSGRVYDIKPEEEALKFFRNKLAPLPSEVVTRVVGENAIGEKPGELLSLKTVRDLFMPLLADAAWETFSETGSVPATLRTIGAELVGVGTSTYGTGQAGQVDLAKSAYGREFDSLPSETQVKINEQLLDRGVDLSDKDRVAPYWRASDEAYEGIRAKNMAALGDYETLDDLRAEVEKRILKLAREKGQEPTDDEVDNIREGIERDIGLAAEIKRLRQRSVASDPGIYDALRRLKLQGEIKYGPSQELRQIAEASR